MVASLGCSRKSQNRDKPNEQELSQGLSSAIIVLIPVGQVYILWPVRNELIVSALRTTYPVQLRTTLQY